MSCSKTKKWIIGILFLAAAMAVTGYVMTTQGKESLNKGTLVRAVRSESGMVKEKLKDGGEFLQEKMKDGSMFLCEKINRAAGKL